MKKKSRKGLKQLFPLALYVSDVVSFIISFILALLIILNRTEFYYTRVFLFFLLILLVNHSAFKLYRDKRSLFDENDVLNIIKSVAMSLLIVFAVLITFRVYEIPLIILLLTVSFFTVIITIICRSFLAQIVILSRRKGYDQKRVFFFGKKASDLVLAIKENASLGYKVLGSTNSLSVLKSNLKKVDLIFVTKENITEELMTLIISTSNLQWKIVPSTLNLVIDPINFDEFKDYPVINVLSATANPYHRYLKRIIDFTLGIICLAALSPLFLFIALMQKITMPGPVFFKQERPGKDAQPFLMYKFRSMIVGADKKKTQLTSETKGIFKMKEDPRITPFGKFLRRTCLDELGQLVNIVKGDMSFVGPRPYTWSDMPSFIGWRKARFNVKPGLTGLWQVSGRHQLNFDKAVLYDIYYIRHMSLKLDLKILFKTIPSIILSRGRF